jgi:tryptophan 2,3-dioxygenase
MVSATAGDRTATAVDEYELTYGQYLRLPDLLAIQEPRSVPAAHDEPMFIIVHQAYELWFRLLLHELTAARDAMLAGQIHQPGLMLQRCVAVERLMVHQIDLLDTLSPARFLEFRTALGSASGFQSTQFREIEFLSGWKDARYTTRLPWLSAAERSRLQDRLREPSLWDALLAALAGMGFDVDDPVRRRAALATVACGAPADRDVWRLAEGLLDHDQAWSLWRGRHALMVERLIGTRTGTGGSTGVEYLRSRQHEHFYPELWEVRGQL